MPEYIDNKGCLCVRDFKKSHRNINQSHIEYQKHEFCKDSGCHNFDGVKCNHAGKNPLLCNRTAREFHEWLEDKGFKIVKE